MNWKNPWAMTFLAVLLMGSGCGKKPGFPIAPAHRRDGEG